MSARVNPHKSWSRLSAARQRKAASVERKGLRLIGKRGGDAGKGERLRRRGVTSGTGKMLRGGTHTEGPVGRLPNPSNLLAIQQLRAKGEALINKAYELRLSDKEESQRLYSRGLAIVHHTQRLLDKRKKQGKTNPTPNEWDDETLNEAARLGSTQARALGKQERASRSGPRFFNVTWFSPTRQKRVGFIRPIEATSAADAKRQAKAMITNEKAVNVVAKPTRGNGDAETRRNPKDFERFDPAWLKWLRSLSVAELAVQLQRHRSSSLEADAIRAIITEKDRKNRNRNPGIMEIAGGLQALDYLGEKVGVSGKRKRNPGDLRSRLVAAATAYDRAQSKGKRYNQYALGQYFQRIDEVVADIEAGATPRAAITAGFSGALANKLLKAAGEAKKVTDSESRGGWYYTLASKKNPSVNEMSERFQGRATGKTEDYYFSDSAPRLDMSRGGKLVFLKLKGTTIRVPQSVVAIDPKSEKLWLGSKGATGMFKRKANKGERLDYGDVDAICYLTAKTHIGNGKQYEYVHTFGEDGGRKPRLLIDHEGMPILQGGDYKIEDRGIVN